MKVLTFANIRDFKHAISWDRTCLLEVERFVCKTNKNPLGHSQLGNEIRDMFFFPKVKGESRKGYFFFYFEKFYYRGVFLC